MTMTMTTTTTMIVPDAPWRGSQVPRTWRLFSQRPASAPSKSFPYCRYHCSCASLSLFPPLSLSLSFFFVLSISPREFYSSHVDTLPFSLRPLPLSIAAAEINVPRRLSRNKLNVDGDYIATKSWGFYKSQILETQLPLAMRLPQFKLCNVCLYYRYGAKNKW